ncbi:MAG: YaiI/YqxD family protein [Planctomycetota bacterium]
MRIWIDADGCPGDVKSIVFRASDRLDIPVALVANAVLPTEGHPLVESVAVGGAFNAADDHIAEHVAPGDLAITADIPLAARVVEAGAVALDPRGELYTEANVGERLSMRNFMKGMRASGYVQGGPASYDALDKQAFANALDRFLTRRLKGRPPTP